MESITIRLDKIASLPVSRFPEVTADQKVWIREERRVQAQTELFNLSGSTPINDRPALVRRFLVFV